MPSLSLNMTIRQEMKLQPRQIICNELLMLPLQDLMMAVKKELEENVCLESDDQQDFSPGSVDIPAQPTQATPPGGDVEPATNGEEAAQDPGQLRDLLEYLRESKTSTSSVSGDLPDAFDPENRSLPSSWRSSLQEALRLERLGVDVERAAEYIVGCLDDSGYFREPLADLQLELDLDLDLIEEALEAVQRAAPPGIGARDLRERLLLVCQYTPDRNEMLERLIRECFDELIQGKFDRIQKRLGLDGEELRELLQDLKERYHQAAPPEEGEAAASVNPDACVEKDADGIWRVRLYDERLPQLRLSAYASGLARQSDTLNEQAREYLGRAFNRAKWIMEALEQRRSTLRRIVEGVVERQLNFFDLGPGHLEPLRQEDVANSLRLHPSTVSRAVQDKYIETPHGVFPLKDFFPRGVVGSNGEQQARGGVQDRLKQIIDGEDPDQPYSDDYLVALLKREGIPLSRRTVCKYRDEMNIPPASKRKVLRRVMSGA